MKQPTWDSEVRRVAKDVGKYDIEAYFFIYEALEYTLHNLERDGHVTGRELLRGIRDLAKERFGFLAKPVLDFWGVHSTRDFGEIVFALVGAGQMGKTEEDSIDDFSGVYDFEDVFVRDFRFKIEIPGKPKTN
ncbi:MAG: Minf_1886 family protein [Planctomycetota bacterium]|jgi:uncharacterized repeat protein (TIGR04138 family)